MSKPKKKSNKDKETHPKLGLKAIHDPREISSYAQQFKHKQEVSKSHLEDSTNQILGGINFDDLEDWNAEDKNKSKTFLNLLRKHKTRL